MRLCFCGGVAVGLKASGMNIRFGFSAPRHKSKSTQAKPLKGCLAL